MNKYITGAIALLMGLAALPAFAQTTGDVAPDQNQSSCVSLTANLQYRSTGAEVSALQDFLQSSGYLNVEPTGYFGLLTVRAVKKFQSANSVLASGYVGPITRAKINVVSCRGTTTTQSSGTQNTTSSAAGCLPGARFSSTTGRSCTVTTSSVRDCESGARFSSLTGNACDGSTQSQSSINVTYPATGVTLTQGQPTTIAWSGSNNGSYVISAAGKGDVGTFSASQVCNAKCSISWTPNFSTPRVTIGIYNTLSGASGTSGTFAITPSTTIQSPGASVTITASPSMITAGQSSTLTLSSQNASHCTVSNVDWSSGKTFGGATVSPIQTTTYTALCTGSDGRTVTQSTTVTVTSSATTQPTTSATQPNFIITGMEPNATGAMAIVGQPYPGTVGIYTSPDVLNLKQISFFGLQGLPPGLVADTYITQLSYAGHGYISFEGTPTQAGTYTVTATFTYGNNYTVSKSFNLTVNPAVTVTPVTCAPSNNSATPVSTTNSVGTIAVTSPNGGDCLTKGSTSTITWTNTSNIDKVTLYYVAPSGIQGNIASNIPNTGSYSWNVNVGNTTNTQFKIEVLGYQTGVGSVMDYSDNYFTVN